MTLLLMLKSVRVGGFNPYSSGLAVMTVSAELVTSSIPAFQSLF